MGQGQRDVKTWAGREQALIEKLLTGKAAFCACRPPLAA
jgi:hypothetical protein